MAGGRTLCKTFGTHPRKNCATIARLCQMKWRTLRGQPIDILTRGSRASSHIGELIMASQHVESLMIARNSMVEVRRRLALKIGNPNMQPPEYASFRGRAERY